jgi:putative membrane protein
MQALILVVKGIFIGVANILPSISGGTLALIMGVYHEMMYALGNILNIFRSRTERTRILRFLVPLGIGMVAGTILFAQVVEGFLKSYPVQIQLVFVGLIAGSLSFIAHHVKLTQITPVKIAGLLAGIGLMVWFTHLQAGNGGGFAPVLFMPKLTAAYAGKLLICGVIGAAAMVIPGISGTMVLVVLGEYTNILYYLNTVTKSFFQIFNGSVNWDAFGAAFVFMAIFGVSFIAGIIFFAKFINLLLERYGSFAFSLILGLLLGSMYNIWPGLAFEMPALAVNLLCLAGGFAAAVLMGKSGGKG